jgi:hypothetical protein
MLSQCGTVTQNLVKKGVSNVNEIHRTNPVRLKTGNDRTPANLFKVLTPIHFRSI